MDYLKLKRIAPFIYYIPAIAVIFFELPMPHYGFLLLIIPYVALTLFVVKKLPKEQVGNVDYIRLAFLIMTHITLYILMYWR